MPSLSYLKYFGSHRFEKAKAIEHRLSIGWGVKYIFLFQSSTGCTRVPNQFDILNVHIEWSSL